MFPQSSTFTSDLVDDLDKQLSHLSAVAHVTVDDTGNLALVAIGQSWPAPLPLRHPDLSSFVEAEALAARVNTLQGASDRDRISALRSMVNARWT